MFDTSTQHAFAPLGMLGQQPGPSGHASGQTQVPGFVPIIGLVPQSLIVNLVAQCLQQAQLAGLTQPIATSPFAGLIPQNLFGNLPGQLGQPQPLSQSQYGQPYLSPTPWAAPGGWAGQPPYSGAAGRGI